MFRSDILSTLALGLFLASNVYINMYLFPEANEFATRQAGEALNGYWYIKDMSSGCHLGATIYEIKDRKFNTLKAKVTKHARKTIYDIEAVQFSHQNIVTIQMVQNLTFNNGDKIYKKHITITAQDLGDRLVPIQSMTELEGKTADVTENEPILFHCSYETLYDRTKYVFGFQERIHPNRLD